MDIQKLNYYAIILVLFIIAGFIAVLWGWFIIAKARKTLRWTMVEGAIKQSAPTSEADDLLPHILFSCTLDFPDGTEPSPELTTSYAKKYPAGAKVSVYYNPDQPDQDTLEPCLARGDWMIPAVGIIAMAFGIFALFFSSY